MDDVITDPRFSHIARDPRFRKMKRKDRKVKIDDRFKDMFKDKRFNVKYTIDKRGRPFVASSSENLRKYYDLSSDDSDDSENEENDKPDVKSIDENNKQESENKSEESSEESEDGGSSKEHTQDATDETKVDKLAARMLKSTMNKQEGEQEDEDEESEDESSEDEIKPSTHGGVDYARGEGMLESSSDDTSDDDSDILIKDDGIEHDWAELDKDAPEAVEVTSRLALCNMDWDRISVQDILMLLSSFTPTGGSVRCVKIYPSEFGLQRMKEEELKGPIELVDAHEEKHKTKAKTTNSDGDEYDMERLRQYQLKRLKYYYAVVECDSERTANHIYSECDGLEFETSANKLDIRFIPDDMTFDHEPKSIANDVNVAGYKPTAFFNTALQHSKVECTWDEDDQKRIQVTRRKLTQEELDTLDLQAYLASESDSEPDQAIATVITSTRKENNVDSGGHDTDGSDDDGEKSEEEESVIIKYRRLLLEGNKDIAESRGGRKKQRGKEDGGVVEEPEMEMQISWEPGIKANAEKLVAGKQAANELSPWEMYLRKKKENKKKKREDKKAAAKEEDSTEENRDQTISDDDLPSDVDLDDPFFKDILGDTKPSSKDKKGKEKKKKKKKEAEPKTEEDQKEEGALELLMLDDDDTKQHFHLGQLLVPEKESKTQRKKRLKREALEKKKQAALADNFMLDVDDPRFRAVYENPLFNIDPSAPEFKKTKQMQHLVSEKVKRSEHKRKSKGDGSIETQPGKKQKTETANDLDLAPPKEQSLDSLIKSVKSKAKVLESKKKR